MSYKKQFNVSSLIVGLVLLVLILAYIGPMQIAGQLFSISLEIFIISGIVYLIANLAGVLKLMTIFPISFRKAFFSHEVGMFFSNVTPAKIGYFYTSYSLKKKLGGSISENMGVLTMLQTITLAVKFFLLVLTIAYFSFSLSFFVFLLFLVPLVIVSGSLIVLFTRLPHKVLRRIPLLNKIVFYVELMQSAMKKYNKKVVIRYILLDLAGWLIIGLQWYLLLNGIGINASYVFSLMIQPLITALMYVPFTLNGLGISEIGNALLFTIVNMSTNTGAVAFLLLLRINSIIFDLVGLGDFKVR